MGIGAPKGEEGMTTTTNYQNEDKHLGRMVKGDDSNPRRLGFDSLLKTFFRIYDGRQD